MAVRIKSILEQAKDPARIKEQIARAQNKSLSFNQRREAIGWIRGAVTFYKGESGKTALVKYLQTMVSKCSSELS